MSRRRFVVVIVIAACGRSAAPPPTAPTAPIARAQAPSPLAGADSIVVANELVRLARAGDRATLERLVDWDHVRALAPLSSAFVADLDHLVPTLAFPPACTPSWTRDDGGHRLDFPPAMTDDPDDVAAAKDAVKAELYRGEDVVASCGGREHAMIQLLRGDGGTWRIRGWARLGD